MALLETFRHNLNQVMNERKLSNEKLADLIVNTASTNWIPRITTIERICEALGVDPIAMMEE